MAFRSSDRNYRGGTGDLILNKPAGTAEHDVLVIGMTGYQLTYNLPSGFLQIGTDLDVAGPDGQRISVFRKVAGASEPSDYTITITSGFEPTAFIMSFSGRDTASPISAYQPSSSASSNATPITLSMTGVTAAAGDDMLTVYAGDTTQAADRWSGSPPDGYTEREDYDPQDWSGIYAHTLDNVSAGATGTLQPMLTRTVGSGGAGWLGFVIALKAAAGSPPGETFAANAAAVAAAAGALLTNIQLDADATSIAVANGQLSTQIRMSAAAIAQSVAAAAMATGINLDADAVMQAAASGALSTQIRMIAAAAGVANASGTLGLQATLSATAIAQAAATAGLNTQIRLSAQAQAQATASAGLAGTGATLAASASSIAVANGQLFTLITLDADAIAHAIMAGGLFTNILLDADAAAAVMATATLQVGTLLDWTDIPVIGNAWNSSQNGLILVPARTGLNLRKLH